MVRQPRFAMSFGMAFFALSVGLTVAGVKPADIRAGRLAAVRDPAHVLQHAGSGRSLLRQCPSSFMRCRRRVRGIKRNLTPAEPGQTLPAKQKERKNDTTQQPEQKQERNYSQMENQLILASAPLGSIFSRSACSVGDH